MAASLRATLLSNTVWPSKKNDPPATGVFLKPVVSRNLHFSVDLKGCTGQSGFCPGKKTGIAVSAISGIASSVVSEDIVSLLDTVEVFDLNGIGIPISHLWKDRKAVVAFARHFGCVLCRRRADFLASKKDRMDASGVALVLVGPGSIDQAKAFSDQTKFKGGTLLGKHDYHLKYNIIAGLIINHSAGLKIIQSYMEGYRQDWELSFEKDTRTRGGWQQGGIIVAGPGTSNISYIHKYKRTEIFTAQPEVVQTKALPKWSIYQRDLEEHQVLDKSTSQMIDEEIKTVKKFMVDFSKPNVG
ncbi:hypothetical protein HHK36_010876 [Tetracentron sinense]|uniref:Uncharacterized protein n=1 Tax=Tetracentron sinense TaxID=13715 RepID=A0A834Z9B3_TETSI|nr:hypothetical protein HHK36_010876 [Tetracentron sinense]